MNIESMDEDDNSPNASEIVKYVHKDMDIISPLLRWSDGLSLFDVTKVDFNNIKMIENQ